MSVTAEVIGLFNKSYEFGLIFVEVDVIFQFWISRACVLTMRSLRETL